LQYIHLGGGIYIEVEQTRIGKDLEKTCIETDSRAGMPGLSLAETKAHNKSFSNRFHITYHREKQVA